MDQDQKKRWEKIIFNPQNRAIDLNSLDDQLKEYFTKEYERIKSGHPSVKYYDNEPYINNFISNIPEKLEKLQLLIRPYKDKFFSCIITDEEVDVLASHEHFRWVDDMSKDVYHKGDALDIEENNHFDLTHFSNLDIKRQRFYRELIYTIPVILNRCGYEVFKPTDQAFIKNELVEKLAYAIHERYRAMMREMDEKSKKDSVYEKLYIVTDFNRKFFSVDYNKLPDDIKSSNIDSAYHIATKMLSIGYTINEADGKTDLALLFLSETEIETMAKLEHERWAWEKRLKGFTYSEKRDDDLKKHHCLLPYRDLPELEKEKDRVQVRFYPALLLAINYTVVALTTEQMQNISYIPRQRVLLQESLFNIEKSIDSLNDKVFGDEEKNINIKNHLTETINNISTTIHDQYAASQIQQCSMPPKLFFRACLPDSFILFKPKDILCGDFYFISKVRDSVIFAAADCTGHGTSGAMLSMICSSFLDQAVNSKNLSDPSKIIGFVYKKIVDFMKRHNNSTISDYGMEIAICTLNSKTRKILFAGINRPLYFFRKDKLEILEPQKVRAGEGYHSVLYHLEPPQKVNFQRGDTLYVFSDGYADQIGGAENRKFLTRNLKILLENIHTKTMLQQYEILNNTIEQWKGSGSDNVVEQTDDILVIGVKIK